MYTVYVYKLLSSFLNCQYPHPSIQTPPLPSISSIPLSHSHLFMSRSLFFSACELAKGNLGRKRRSIQYLSSVDDRKVWQVAAGTQASHVQYSLDLSTPGKWVWQSTLMPNHALQTASTSAAIASGLSAARKKQSLQLTNLFFSLSLQPQL